MERLVLGALNVVLGLGFLYMAVTTDGKDVSYISLALFNFAVAFNLAIKVF